MFSRARLAVAAAAVVAAAVPLPSSAFTPGGTHGGRLIAPGFSSPVAVTDGASGSIIAMQDATTGTTLVNRFGPTGAKLWNQGISYQDSNGVQLEPDGTGGAIVGVQRDDDGLTLARILSSGATTWQAQFAGGIVAAGGDGGAWVVSQSQELFADGITAAGEPRPRVQLTSSPAAETLPVAVGDGEGGIYLAWRSALNDTQFSIQLQHLSADGSLWDAPANVAGSSDGNLTPQIGLDGRGGVVVWWHAAGTLWVADYASDGSPRWGRTLTFPGASPTAAVVGAEHGVFVAHARILRQPPLATELLSVSYAGANGVLHWTRNIATADGGILDLQTAPAGDAIAVGWQTGLLPPVGSVLDTDLHVARITADGGAPYGNQALATNLGPEAFGSLVEAGAGSVVAVFTQAPCLRSEVTGVAIQRIAPDGRRAFGADGACP